MKRLKFNVSYVRLIAYLLLHRNFLNISYDKVQKYGHVEVIQLWKLKLSIKIGKAELDTKFLR